MRNFEFGIQRHTGICKELRAFYPSRKYGVYTHTHIYTVKDVIYIYIHHVDAYVHTRACKIPLLIYAPMKTCMPTLRSNVHNRDGASTVRIASVTRTHAFQGRCLQFHEGALVSLADGLHEFFFEKGLHMVAWYIYIYMCYYIYIYIYHH